jgi:hypothetical protein
MVVVVTTVGFEYTFPLRVIMFEGSLFPRGDLTTGEVAGGFPLKVIGGLLYLFLICGVAR